MREVAQINTCAKVHFEEWVDMAADWPSDCSWESAVIMADEIEDFVNVMAEQFQRLLHATCGETAYAHRAQMGHDFLNAIDTKLSELGIAMLEKVDVPLSPSDCIRMATNVTVTN